MKPLDFTSAISDNPLSPRGFPQATLTLCRWQKAALAALLLALAAWAIADWRQELLVINVVLMVFYLASTLYRILIIHLALAKPRDIILPPEDLPTEAELFLQDL